MIYTIAKVEPSPQYTQGILDEFFLWEAKQRNWQLDIETDISPYWCNKKLISIQFGSYDGNSQWFIQWSMLTQDEQEKLRTLMNGSRKMKLCHNGAFEYIVLRFYGIILENIYDTMIIEQVLRGGLEDTDGYSLADLTYDYVCVRLDKSEQMSFSDDQMTPSKIIYGITDVKYLGAIRNLQFLELQLHDLTFVAALENEVLLSFADITYEGLPLDQEKWRANIALAQPLVDSSLDQLNDWIRKEPMLSVAKSLGYYKEETQILINWNSAPQKQRIFQYLFPDMGGATKAVVQRYVRDNPYVDQIDLLRAYLAGNMEPLRVLLRVEHEDWLIEQGLMLPAGTVTINWGSPVQILPILKAVEPSLTSTDAESLGRTTHPSIRDLEEYRDNLRLISSYGEKFIEKQVEPDGRVRTSFNQVLTTGRVSSYKPNMQNIPAKESVGNRYRNCFICAPTWCYVSSDYVSQELIIIAYLSNDPVWKAALARKEDLHSVAAEIVFGKKWKDATEEGCAYYKLGADGQPAHKKCNCKKHKYMRSGTKTVDFGLAYGMSYFKLAGTLRISLKEAKQLIVDYFKAFPGIGRLLNSLGRFGVRNGYIMTIAPFYRKRWFPNWKYARSGIESHIQEIKYDATLGSIERGSKNQPIQGTAADQMKTAMCIIRTYMREHDLFDTKVKMVMQVHDQLDTITIKEYAETWKPILNGLMEEAALLNIPTGLLKADTTIASCWTK